MKGYLAESGSILPLISLIVFVTIFSLVVVYLLTDRRKTHHCTMSALPLEDSEDGPHG